VLKLRYVAALSIAAIALSGSVATGSAGVSTPTDVVAISPVGVTVGVAHPVTVTFAGNIEDRAAAEHSFGIASPGAPEGDFTWLNDRVLQWSPSGFWPAHSDITVTAGGAKASFQTGSTTVGVADIGAHTRPCTPPGERGAGAPEQRGNGGRGSQWRLS